MYLTSIRSKKISQSGFTLVETLAAIGIGVMVALFVVMIATDTLKATAQIHESERLHADVMHITTKMSYYIKQSRQISEFDDSSGFTLSIPKFSAPGVLEGIDHIEIKHENDSIDIAGDRISGDNLEIVDFFAEVVNNSVQIRFSIKYKGSDRDYSFTTTLARRNN